MVITEKQYEWVNRLRGDEAERDLAIEELRVLLTGGLSKSLSNRYGGGVQVEDIVQEALMKILDSLDMFEGRSRFTTWAMTIATRIGISELRRKRYQDVSIESLKNGESLTFEVAIDNRLSTDDQLDRKQLLDTLRKLIDSELTQKQRIAVHALLKDLPIEEIARRTESNRNAVYKLIHDARLRLHDGFTQSGIPAEEVRAILA